MNVILYTFTHVCKWSVGSVRYYSAYLVRQSQDYAVNKQMGNKKTLSEDKVFKIKRVLAKQ